METTNAQYFLLNDYGMKNSGSCLFLSRQESFTVLFHILCRIFWALVYGCRKETFLHPFLLYLYKGGYDVADTSKKFNFCL